MADSKSIKPSFYERFWSRVARADGDACWEWAAARFTAGYGKVALPRSRKLEGAHRIAWLLTYGPIPNDLWVLHRCDNPPCCRPDHLFLGTCKNNSDDMIAKGRHPRVGVSVPSVNRKLSADRILEIRARAVAGESHRAIALALNINRRTIDRIVSGALYRDVA